MLYGLRSRGRYVLVQAASYAEAHIIEPVLNWFVPTRAGLELVDDLEVERRDGPVERLTRDQWSIALGRAPEEGDRCSCGATYDGVRFLPEQNILGHPRHYALYPARTACAHEHTEPSVFGHLARYCLGCGRTLYPSVEEPR